MKSKTKEVKIFFEANIKKIQKLIGNVTEEQLRYVDCFVSNDIGLFIPSVGPCFQAITPRHTHPAYLFILAFDDSCKLEIGDKIITSEPGKICAISPDIPHHEISSDDFSRYIAIFVDKSFFESQLKVYSISEIKPIEGGSFDSSPELMAPLKEFMIEYENKMPGYENLLEAIGLKITHVLIRVIYGFTSPAARIASRIEVDKVIAYLHANYDKKVAVEEMAGVALLSPSHFARVFKRETGKSPMDYLIDLRLNKAKKLLRAGDRTITEIALECGFASSSHFSSCFRQEFAITPSQFQKSLK